VGPAASLVGVDPVTGDVSPPRPQRLGLALLAITLAGFVLRLHDLQGQSFWLDEVDAIAFAGADLSTQLRKLTSTGENGPLYFLLFKGWLALAGVSEFGARYLSVMASTLAIPLLGRLTWCLFRNRPTALIARSEERRVG
jgi:uncharacterized membrane protein